LSDIVFLQMPLAGVQRPSIALGLFASSLRAAHIPVEVLYANITFAELIGLPAYYLVGEAPPHVLIGDWIFAESAFGDAARELPRLPMDRGLFYLDAEVIDAALEAGGHADISALLAHLRRRACEFIDELARDVVARRPRVVACTSMFDQHVASVALLRRVKALDPAVLTVIGGANCAGPMGRATHDSFPWVDFTVTGEFDQFAVAFFAALRAAGGDPGRVAPVPNVLGPADRGEGAGRALPPTVLLQDMDAAAVPDYDDYFEQIYSSPLAPYVTASLPFETSRGCWWGAKQHCTFCGLNAEGMAFRKKSPARALSEIRGLTERYGISRCFGTDNIIDMSYFQSVLPQLAADQREYHLFYETKANLKREHVKALADAGCNRIQPGIESLHDETLAIMRKGTTACANIQLLKHCVEFGVAPAWSILCNFPGSEPEWVSDVARDFVSLFHLPPPFGATPIRFDRFSPYHQRPEQFGLALEPMESYRRIYPLAESVLQDIAYFFQDARGVAPAVAEHAYLSHEIIRGWRAQFWSADRRELVVEADDGDALRVRDTRSCASSAVHELRGPLAAVLRALATPVSRAGLARLVTDGGRSIDEGDLCELLDELLERRLVWRSDTQLVALPTPPPRRPLRQGRAMGDVQIMKCLREGRAFGVPA
jgi:magnesium-protoporphyrin IX monomethyl ester (oxidative) cyclase